MSKKRIAVVTGASGGFGREFARLLALEDDVEEVWALGRNEVRLNGLAADIGDKIRSFCVDAADLGAIKGFARNIAAEDAEIAYLVNAAGYAKFCAYDGLSPEESLDIIDVNVCGTVATDLVCLPYMKRGGRILNVSSLASFFPLPYLNLYGATKVFIRNYSRALNVELKHLGITVTAVCPGWMSTHLYDRAEIGAPKAINKFAAMTAPDKVAAKALRDAKKGKDMSVYGVYVKVMHMLTKFLPQRLSMKVWLIQQGIDPREGSDNLLSL